MNGAPHKAVIETIMAEVVKGSCLVSEPIVRRSWE